MLALLAHHDCEGAAFREDEKQRLQADLDHAIFLIPRNQGLLTRSKSIADAFLSMHTFGNTCQI